MPRQNCAKNPVATTAANSRTTDVCGAKKQDAAAPTPIIVYTYLGSGYGIL